MSILQKTGKLFIAGIPIIAFGWVFLFLTVLFDQFFIGRFLALAYLVLIILILWKIRPFKKAVLFEYALFGLVLIVWCLQFPSNNRPWQRDVALLPWAQISGPQITIHNIRNCNYRSETDYDVSHYDKTVNLNDLISIDLILVDWGLGKIAHTMFSFGFKDGSYLCTSIETRKEIGENYSAVKGFFRTYELIYIVADERDLIRLRTNFREDENVYLYPLNLADDDIGKQVFLEYINRINALKKNPEWYNALTENCMTSAFRLIRKHAVHNKWNWKIFMNGYAAELAYDYGIVYNKIPFEQLRKTSLINAAAKSCTDLDRFSVTIRAALPK